jgi:dihydroorotase
VKYYPAGATTNSDSGVTDIRKCDRVFEAMQQVDMPLLLHGEVTDLMWICSTGRKCLSSNTWMPLKQRFPKLRVVLEHVTTSDAVEFVQPLTISPPLSRLSISCLAATSSFKGGCVPIIIACPF